MKSYKTSKIKQLNKFSIILKKELTMDLKKQILVALGLDKQDEVALEYQAKLEDGTFCFNRRWQHNAIADWRIQDRRRSKIQSRKGRCCG